MVVHKMNSFLILSLLLASYGAQAQLVKEDDLEDSIELFDALGLTEANPLTVFAQKKNGKLKKNFKVPFSSLIEYYDYASHGYIKPNPKSQPLMTLDMDIMSARAKEDIEFQIRLGKRKAYPTEVINPHSISLLFVLDPLIYNSVAGAEDFITAKQKMYKVKTFNAKKVKYDYSLVHLEDWRSLNHPPVMDVGEDLTIWDKDLTPIDYAQAESPFYQEDFQKNIDAVSNTELSFGNKLELLENGDSYKRKILEVRQAKSSVLMAVMSFFCDQSSKQLEDALVERAQSGLDVKLIVEKIWTKLSANKCFNRMKNAGVDVRMANDLLKKGEEMALFHDKFMVIDDRMVIMGGANIMDSDNISTGANHMNRDNDVIAVGPVASDAMLTYVELWRKFTPKNQKPHPDSRVKDISFYEQKALDLKKQDTEDRVRGQGVYAEKLKDKSQRSQGACRFMNQSPGTDKNRLSKVFIEFFSRAQSRLSMTNGNTFYFDLPEHSEKERARDTWNKKFYRSIFSSVERGVQLDIIGNGIDGGYGEASNMFKKMYLKNRFRANPIPRTIASFLADFMDKIAAKTNQPFLENLAKRKNVRAWTHFQYMHSKKMQVDRLVTIVSSYNLDEWSADKSHETAMICMDDTLNSQMERSFLKDVINSEPVAITSN